jgi:queuine tRNA-ribosyltransferase
MFEVIKQDNGARQGKLRTEHGIASTPFFMPVATRAVGRYMTSDDLKLMRPEAIIANAFVLYLNPGTELIRKAGGIHKFMNFDKVIFNDCGGFQMLKESFLEGTTNKGIKFRSPFDGAPHLLTPEKAMQAEMDIKADVVMALDDVPPFGSTKEQIVDSIKRTHDWHKRSKGAHTDKKQLLFGICQGGTYPELRKESTEYMVSLDFDGYSIGGLCLGEPKQKMLEMVGIATSILPRDKPRYLMGVGSPEDIVEAVAHGVDVFDSIYPTQNARHDTMFTSKGKIKIDTAKYKEDFTTLDDNCDCFVCRDYTKAYLRYLAKIDDPMGKRLKSYHNSYFMQRFMENIRMHIKEGTFDGYRKEIRELYKR